MELTEVEKHYDNLILERRWKGRETYGRGLCLEDGLDLNQMAMEEAMDLSQYLAGQNILLEKRLARAKVEIEELKKLLYGTPE